MTRSAAYRRWTEAREKKRVRGFIKEFRPQIKNMDAEVGRLAHSGLFPCSHDCCGNPERSERRAILAPRIEDWDV